MALTPQEITLARQALPQTGFQNLASRVNADKPITLTGENIALRASGLPTRQPPTGATKDNPLVDRNAPPAGSGLSDAQMKENIAVKQYKRQPLGDDEIKYLVQQKDRKMGTGSASGMVDLGNGQYQATGGQTGQPAQPVQPTTSTNPYDASIQAAEEDKKARALTLEEDRAKKLEEYRKNLEAKYAPEFDLLKKQNEQGLQNVKDIQSFSGFGRSTVTMDKLTEVQQLTDQRERAMQAQRSAEEALYEASIRGADSQTLSAMQKNIDDLKAKKYEIDAATQQKLSELDQEKQKVSKDATSAINDGFLYNAFGQRMKDASGQDIALTGASAEDLDMEASNKAGYLIDKSGKPLRNDAGNLVELPAGKAGSYEIKQDSSGKYYRIDKTTGKAIAVTANGQPLSGDSTKYQSQFNPLTGDQVIFDPSTGRNVNLIDAGAMDGSGGGFSSAEGMRTDRHNNPTAFTTDVAKTAGLVEGKDYVKGDPFTVTDPKTKKVTTLYTATLLGDPIATTIKVIDKIGFYTKGGAQRWTHTAMSPQQWKSLSSDQKAHVVGQMYQREGGNGSLTGDAQSQAGQQNAPITRASALVEAASRGMSGKDAEAFAITAMRAGQYPARKPSDTQAQSSAYADRMQLAMSDLAKVEDQFIGQGKYTTQAQRWAPEMFKNETTKLQEQAERNFINALLRKESGANVPDSELANYRAQYFPQAGDTPTVIEQKRRNRQVALEGMIKTSQGAYTGPSSSPQSGANSSSGDAAIDDFLNNLQ